MPFSATTSMNSTERNGAPGLAGCTWREATRPTIDCDIISGLCLCPVAIASRQFDPFEPAALCNLRLKLALALSLKSVTCVAAGVSPDVESGILPGGKTLHQLKRPENFVSRPKTCHCFRGAGCRPLRVPGWPALR